MKKVVLLLFVLFSFHTKAQDCNTEIPFGENAEVGAFARINGANIYFETYGDPENQTILIIHENGGSIKTMGCQISHFLENYHVISADNRAHGKSEGDAKWLTFEQMANDYIAIMDYLSIARVFIIGYGDGANIALELASKHPNRVSKLVVSSPNLRPGSDAIHVSELETNRNYLEKIEEKIFRNDSTNNWERARAQMELMKFQPNMSNQDLKRIECPVLVVASDNDVVKLGHVIDIYNNLKKAQLFIIPNTSYDYIHKEYVFYNFVVEKFLDEPFEEKHTVSRNKEFKSSPIKELEKK
ncbi:alpha/beta fold hydrolase [Aureivirga marina]|uniref:alpha/beta fold hydrolase n=1 Tax=Aureivirga marina TaxID=1182451 RepID=UPI0018CB59B8|nr:alpha/beta hydrolase [Aureivirga marina]